MPFVAPSTGHDGLRKATSRTRSFTTLATILSRDDVDIVPREEVVIGVPRAADFDLAIVDYDYLRYELAKSWRFYMGKQRGRSKISGKARETVLTYNAAAALCQLIGFGYAQRTEAIETRERYQF
jgi:hypothetical protein